MLCGGPCSGAAGCLLRGPTRRPLLPRAPPRRTWIAERTSPPRPAATTCGLTSASDVRPRPAPPHAPRAARSGPKKKSVSAAAAAALSEPCAALRATSVPKRALRWPGDVRTVVLRVRAEPALLVFGHAPPALTAPDRVGRGRARVRRVVWPQQRAPAGARLRPHELHRDQGAAAEGHHQLRARG